MAFNKWVSLNNMNAQHKKLHLLKAKNIYSNKSPSGNKRVLRLEMNRILQKGTKNIIILNRLYDVHSNLFLPGYGLNHPVP